MELNRYPENYFAEADRRQHAEPVGTGEVVALPFQEPIELVEGATLADRQHVDRDAGGIGEFHRLGPSLVVQWIDLCPFKVVDCRRQILRVFEKPAQEERV